MGKIDKRRFGKSEETEKKARGRENIMRFMRGEDFT